MATIRSVILLERCPLCGGALIGRERQSTRHGPNAWVLERRWCPNKCVGVDQLIIDAEPHIDRPPTRD